MLSSLLNFVRIIVSLLCFSRRFVGYFTVWIVSPRSHTARSASAIRDIIGGLPSAGYTYLSAPPSNRSLALILCAFLIGSGILPQPDLQCKGAFVTFRSQTSKYMISVRSFVDGCRRSENGCECYVSVPRCTEQSAGSSVCLRQLFQLRQSARCRSGRPSPRRDASSRSLLFMRVSYLFPPEKRLPAVSAAARLIRLLKPSGYSLYFFK